MDKTVSWGSWRFSDPALLLKVFIYQRIQLRQLSFSFPVRRLRVLLPQVVQFLGDIQGGEDGELLHVDGVGLVLALLDLNLSGANNLPPYILHAIEYMPSS